MEFETKILSKGIQEMLYNSDKTVGTAESCTGGRIAEALISVPGASNYFKGSAGSRKTGTSLVFCFCGIF